MPNVPRYVQARLLLPDRNSPVLVGRLQIFCVNTGTEEAKQLPWKKSPVAQHLQHPSCHSRETIRHLADNFYVKISLFFSKLSHPPLLHHRPQSSCWISVRGFSRRQQNGLSNQLPFDLIRKLHTSPVMGLSYPSPFLRPVERWTGSRKYEPSLSDSLQAGA